MEAAGRNELSLRHWEECAEDYYLPRWKWAYSSETWSRAGKPGPFSSDQPRSMCVHACAHVCACSCTHMGTYMNWACMHMCVCLYLCKHMSVGRCVCAWGHNLLCACSWVYIKVCRSMHGVHMCIVCADLCARALQKGCLQNVFLSMESDAYLFLVQDGQILGNLWMDVAEPIRVKKQGTFWRWTIFLISNVSPKQLIQLRNLATKIPTVCEGVVWREKELILWTSMLSITQDLHLCLPPACQKNCFLCLNLFTTDALLQTGF